MQLFALTVRQDPLAWMLLVGGVYVPPFRGHLMTFVAPWLWLFVGLLLLLLLLCYCVNFACEDCTQGEGDLYNYKQIARLLINFLKMSIEVTSLI